MAVIKSIINNYLKKMWSVGRLTRRYIIFRYNYTHLGGGTQLMFMIRLTFGNNNNDASLNVHRTKIKNRKHKNR